MQPAPAAASLPAIASTISKERWQSCQRCGYAVLFLTAMHALAIGFKGWADPAAWPGRMPPITMLSFLAAVAPLGLRLRRAWRERSSAGSELAPLEER